jgi:hypothetical protein
VKETTVLNVISNASPIEEDGISGAKKEIMKKRHTTLIIDKAIHWKWRIS